MVISTRNSLPLIKKKILIQQKHSNIIIQKFYTQTNYKLSDEIKVFSDQVQFSYSLSQSVLLRGEQYQDLRHSELNPRELQREVLEYSCAVNPEKNSV